MEKHVLKNVCFSLFAGKRNFDNFPLNGRGNNDIWTARPEKQFQFSKSLIYRRKLSGESERKIRYRQEYTKLVKNPSSIGSKATVKGVVKKTLLLTLKVVAGLVLPLFLKQSTNYLRSRSRHFLFYDSAHALVLSATPNTESLKQQNLAHFRITFNVKMEMSLFRL